MLCIANCSIDFVRTFSIIKYYRENEVKKLFLLPLLMIISANIYASDTTVVKTWTPKAVVGLNVNQIAFTNWSQGGENSIAWTIFSNLGLDYFQAPWKLKNSLKVAYGRTKLGDADFRTNDNEIYLESVLSYNIGWAVDPYFSNTVRTSVTSGFDYKVSPSVKIADFFDPGYVTQSLGFTYDRSETITTRLGIAVQEIFTRKFTQYSDDPDTPEIEKIKIETGVESVTELKHPFADNMLFESKLRLFSRFDSLDVWDVRWDNTITAKINDYFHVNLNVLLIHEIGQSLKTQLKQALQLGISYTLF